MLRVITSIVKKKRTEKEKLLRESGTNLYEIKDKLLLLKNY